MVQKGRCAVCGRSGDLSLDANGRWACRMCTAVQKGSGPGGGRNRILSATAKYLCPGVAGASLFFLTVLSVAGWCRLEHTKRHIADLLDSSIDYYSVQSLDCERPYVVPFWTVFKAGLACPDGEIVVTVNGSYNSLTGAVEWYASYDF